MSDTYNASFHCTYCTWKGTLDVPVGTTKSAFAGEQKCEDCKQLSIKETDEGY